MFPFGGKAVVVALAELLEFFVDSLELLLVYFDRVEQWLSRGKRRFADADDSALKMRWRLEDIIFGWATSSSSR